MDMLLFLVFSTLLLVLVVLVAVVIVVVVVVVFFFCFVVVPVPMPNVPTLNSFASHSYLAEVNSSGGGGAYRVEGWVGPL
jgi:uncharacterized membrane protein